MLIDTHGRTITYLRISLTDRCNFRCTYCMPESGVPLKAYREILRYEEITQIARTAAELGITKIRLTGGEPLLKKNIEFLVGSLHTIPGIREISMTTNGSLLTLEKAQALKAAGLKRVNISLDTLDENEFAQITRGGDLSQVLRGIDAALQARLTPVKINMVVAEQTSPRSLTVLQKFCRERGVQLQTIKQFDLYEKQDGSFSQTSRPPACGQCNRLRLTADGYLLPCLFSDKDIKVDFGDIERSITRAVQLKPANGQSCRKRAMHQIGG